MLIGATPIAVVPVFTKLITVPLTVMLSPGTKLVASAFVPRHRTTSSCS